MSVQSMYSSFLSHFRKGVMRSSRFEIEFFLPAGIADDNGLVVDPRARSGSIRSQQQQMNGRGAINIKCHTMTFPQRSLGTYDHRQNSAPFAVPFTSVYDPVTFSFYADNSVDTRRYFDIWHATVTNFRTNTMNFYDEFTSDLDMYTLNEADERQYGVRLFKAFPLSVGAVDMSYSNMNNFANVIATLTYKRWEPIG